MRTQSEWKVEISGLVFRFLPNSSPAVKLTTAAPADLEKILELNLRTQSLLVTMGGFVDGYNKLPAAHDNLRDAADRRSSGLTGLLDFTEETVRLNTLYTEMAAANAAGGS